MQVKATRENENTGKNKLSGYQQLFVMTLIKV